LTVGSIVVPAHNEAAIIVGTIGPLAALIEHGVEIIVSVNGCTDDTAAQARTIPGVVVFESSKPSKAEALNAADSVAKSFPRLYLDADIMITPDAVVAVLDRLRVGDVLAVRPSYRYDTTGAARLVAAYYRARDRIPAMREHMWGAGAYALNRAGHTRLGSFPTLTADDLYIDQLFSREEIAIVETTPVEVRCPRTSNALLRTLIRVQSGRAEVAQTRPLDPVGGLRPLLGGVGGLANLRDAAVYAGFAVASRMLARRGIATWQRDETNRVNGINAHPSGEGARRGVH